MGVNIAINGLFEVNTAKTMNEFILGKSHMHAKVVIKASRQKLIAKDMSSPILDRRTINANFVKKCLHERSTKQFMR